MAASPFNSVKLELAIIIVLVILLWVILEAATGSILVHISALLLFSSVAAIWLIFRVRKLSLRVNRK